MLTTFVFYGNSFARDTCITSLSTPEINILKKKFSPFVVTEEPLQAATPASAGTTPGVAGPGGQKSGQQTDGGPIRAPAPMWRCSKIMHLQRELHPTILNSLEGIVDQVCTKY